MGPTGSGKSSIINRLFNQRVSEEGSDAMSVTRTMTVYEGTAAHRQEVFSVNTIDTMGFCDSTSSEKEVVALLKHFIKAQMTHIDMVVVVVSGRIEQAHVKSIRQLLDWLDQKAHPGNFVFVYNKADQCRNLATVERNITAMATQLETGSINAISQDGSVVNFNIPLGLPPGTLWGESQVKLEKLVDPLFGKYGKKTAADFQRIPVDPSKGCAIC
jgi:GTP-binding protein EngB required for normal cell division